jgi:ATP-dependent helicase/nuclease subunit A
MIAASSASSHSAEISINSGVSVQSSAASTGNSGYSRANTALAYLARNASDWSEAEREALAAQVLALIDDSRFAQVFADGSRAEVAIAGRLTTRRGDPVLVSGQIDRLVVTPEAVLIVDYKTSHAPPTSAADVPAAYVRQLALYRAVLARLYPDLPFRSAQLRTETPDMMEMSA